ncbi:MAG TPA: hypothetical protein PKA98_10445 [Acidimicrobiales bacterium]|nr:hypothetical protein [Acidimicrobiales bacterium]
MGRVVGVVATLGLVTVTALALVACGKDYDLDARRTATPEEYALSDQACAVAEGQALATGTLTNFSGRDTGFGVIVRFLDGDVDLGRPQTVTHPEPLAVGDTWSWEVGLDVEEPPADLRCNVIQVVIGDDVGG